MSILPMFDQVFHRRILIGESGSEVFVVRFLYAISSVLNFSLMVEDDAIFDLCEIPPSPFVESEYENNWKSDLSQAVLELSWISLLGLASVVNDTWMGFETICIGISGSSGLSLSSVFLVGMMQEFLGPLTIVCIVRSAASYSS
ncbi:hypothetical protein K7X08_006166 [Anisodus acutangulus]|uniref:Uncharacterized protein n=1 Tax=Anisodus acutangulus TaxID=402998 RepID=A0A9Q1MUT5_9SOLA|nr:hypothetical protein K7X08_006166 [Anisodus acutangulus]